VKRARAVATEDGSLFTEVARPDRVPPARAAAGGLLVLTSDEELIPWSRRRIVDTLVREARLGRRRAEPIADRVDKQLRRAGMRVVSTSVVRELVGAELVTLGLAEHRTRQARLGVSLYDAGKILRGMEPGGSSGALDPDETSFALARRIKRDYALGAVFSEPVAEAHRSGDLHLYDLEAIDRPESIWLTVEGLQSAGAAYSGLCGRPAATLSAIGATVARLVADLSGHVSGVLGIEALNVGLAPFLNGASRESLRAAATELLQGLADAAAGRARTARPKLVVTLNWDLTPEQEAAPAIGPGGVVAGTGARHAGTARAFALAILEAAHGVGGHAAMPHLVQVIGPRFFRTPGHLGLLELAVDAASKHGAPSFRFERAVSRVVSSRARASERVPVVRLCRRAGLASVAVNLPRLGYLGDGDEEEVEARMLAVLEQTARAHVERRVFLEELLARGANGPLGRLMAPDGGGPILALDEAQHRIVACGLNELVEVVVGAPLAASEHALAYGRRFLEQMRRRVDGLARKHKMRFVLSGTPHAESARRFAKLDLRHHAPVAGHHVKGELRRGVVDYTEGIGVAAAATGSLLGLLQQAGTLHELVDDARFIIPFERLGDTSSSAARFVMEAYLKTECRELAFR